MNTNTASQHLTPTHVAHAVQLTRQLLDAGVDDLPYDITERLRAARMRAIAQVKSHAPTVAQEKHISDGLIGWLQRMPTLAKTLMAIPALCMAIVVAENTSTPSASNIASQPTALMSSPLTAAYAPSSMDTINALNIDAILKEQVPLQAYLNEDFNHFIDQDKQNKAPHPQTSGTNHVQKNTIVQALR
ncbi:hypothetical protein DTO96_101722 [Ephemeroptericola cinctiostellae]|uniref:Uncharacterized protein n=1 Tax=Ephemeroptericola cinctiostellae TaxID=2268024 RepID=A0A345DC94_9BURK|nr:DUF3619 family protein [Ephemeroptericola cinctiostellae]AXF85982.1 hypothetical protein DTO96_101722 [Ephemeroptericola cinctiostellae]